MRELTIAGSIKYEIQISKSVRTPEQP